MKKSKIGIIGMGFVGKAVWSHFRGAPWYSLDGGDFAKVDKAEYIFICLPTPFVKGKGFDYSALYENIGRLTGHKNIIIKSTVLPGTTRKISKQYPQHKFFFNPEFLRAKTHLQDYFAPDRQIVGYVNEGDKELARKILAFLPKAPNQFVCLSEEAEMAKLTGNCFLSLKVVFANQIYDYCKKKNIDYDRMIELVKADPRIGESHFNIFTDGHRGYSGLCFPKDMGAVIHDSKSELLKKADDINNELLPRTT